MMNENDQIANSNATMPLEIYKKIHSASKILTVWGIIGCVFFLIGLFLIGYASMSYVSNARLGHASGILVFCLVGGIEYIVFGCIASSYKEHADKGEAIKATGTALIIIYIITSLVFMFVFYLFFNLAIIIGLIIAIVQGLKLISAGKLLLNTQQTVPWNDEYPHL